jgi:RimJ/RimL family protein N-acetyltransferase
MTADDPMKGVRNTYQLVTKRLRLEVPTIDDGEDLYRLAGGKDRSEITAGLIWDGPEDVSETQGFIQQSRTKSYDDFGFHWVIRDAAGTIAGVSGAPIGMISARPSGEPGRGDVGYWLGKAYWDQGIMGEALRSVLHLCFGDLAMVKIEAEIFTTNTRSIRLVESIGMKLEGTVRSAHLKRGQWVDAHIYGILREEWAGYSD